MHFRIPGLGRKDVVVVDHSLIDEAGHHLNVALALNTSLAKSRHRATFLTHNRFPATRYPELRAEPVFTARCYDFLFSVIDRPGRLEALRRKFGVELDVHLRDRKAHAIVLPTLTHVEIHELALWIGRHPNPSSLRVYFWAVFGPEFLTEQEGEADQAATSYEEAFAALDDAAETGASICPIVETQGLFDKLQPMTSLEILVLRLPSMVHELSGQSNSDGHSHRLVIGYGGDVRPGKGFELLPDIIRLCLKQRSDIEFYLRIATEALEDGDETLVELSSLGSNVRVQIGALPPVDFQRFLASCDLILLPYSPEVYTMRGSSICDEAEVLGIPQVVPRHVSFSDRVLAAGAALGFDNFTAGDIAETLLVAVNGIADLKKKAEQSGAKVHNQNQAFLKLITNKTAA